MIPRWPLPIGEIKSMIRAVMFVGSLALDSSNFSSGNNGVRSSNFGRGFIFSTSMPLIVRMSSMPGFFSFRPAGRDIPVT